MTTALSEGKNVTKAFDLGCTAYAGKPIDQDKFENVLRKLELIRSNN
jgi:two-component system chemotaxis response regulator CheY